MTTVAGPGPQGFRPQSGEVWPEVDIRHQTEPHSRGWRELRERSFTLYSQVSGQGLEERGEGQRDGREEATSAVTISS